MVEHAHPADLEIAVSLQECEIEEFLRAKGEVSADRLSQVENFREYAVNLLHTTAVLDLHAQFQELRIQEHDDHNLARSMAVPPLSPLSPLPPLPPALQVQLSFVPIAQEDDELTPPKPAQLKSPSGRPHTVPQKVAASGHGRNRAAHPLTKDVEKTCGVCYSSTRIYVEAPCPSAHIFCAACLRKTFELGIADRSLLPIKCCRVELDQNLAKFLLPPADFDKLAQILYEERTVNKMYCANSKCSIFIDIDTLTAAGLVDTVHQFDCPSCQTSMCASCKVASHEGATCAQYQALPEDEREDASLHNLARAEGLSRCDRCKHFVQLTQGCNHMTCICSYEFCYPCRAQWKTCACPQWDEGRIIEAGQQRVGPNADPAAVARAIRQIRIEEECTHDFKCVDIFFHQGNRGCANCGFTMRRYRYKCNTCQYSVCHTCRFHRLA